MSKAQFLKKTSNLIPCVLFSFTLLSSDLVLGMNNNDSNDPKTVRLKSVGKAFSHKNKFKSKDLKNEIYQQDHKSPSKTVAHYQKAIQKGDVGAMVDLARIYINVKYTSQGPEEAIRLYKEAVKLNNIDAIFDLADLYLSGDGVKKDSTKARRLYEKAIIMG